MKDVPQIAIVGAGFSGTLLAVQLAKQAQKPLHVFLFDAKGAFKRGIAYGTREPSHLLNVRADKMGAFEDAQDDFYRWLLVHEKDWRAKHTALKDLVVKPDGFMPRMLYGDYIEALYEKAKRNPNGVTFEEITDEVTDAEAGDTFMTLTLAHGEKRKIARLVLAVGNLLGHRQSFEKRVAGNLRYVGNLWATKPGSILTRDHFTPEDSPVLIVGTGLTMVDMLLSLHHRRYSGRIMVVSRHGLLPQPHDTGITPHSRFLLPETAPRTALGLVTRIRREIQKTGLNWRAIVDALRPDTQALWVALPEKERRKLTRILPYWGVHRHRMPVSSADFITNEKQHGRLEIRHGDIVDIREGRDCLLVDVRHHGKSEIIEAAHVLNCAGPGMNIDTSANPLLLGLKQRGYIAKGPIGMGIAAENDGRIKGPLSERLFALGPLLTGERLETIAVPELRQQAQMLAGALLVSLDIY